MTSLLNQLSFEWYGDRVIDKPVWGKAPSYDLWMRLMERGNELRAARLYKV